MENEGGAEAVPRIEWWGGDKDVTREGLLRPLLGQGIVAVHHAALVGRNDDELTDHLHICTSSVVFTLEDGRRWELLDAQISDMQALIFKEIHADPDLVTSMDVARAPEEHATTVPSTLSDPRAPWRIAGITEVWGIQRVGRIPARPCLMGAIRTA